MPRGVPNKTAAQEELDGTVETGTTIEAKVEALEAPPEPPTEGEIVQAIVEEYMDWADEDEGTYSDQFGNPTRYWVGPDGSGGLSVYLYDDPEASGEYAYYKATFRLERTE